MQGSVFVFSYIAPFYDFIDTRPQAIYLFCAFWSVPTKASTEKTAPAFTFFSEWLTMITADDIDEFVQTLAAFQNVAVVVSDSVEVTTLTCFFRPLVPSWASTLTLMIMITMPMLTMMILMILTLFLLMMMTVLIMIIVKMMIVASVFFSNNWCSVRMQSDV